MTSTLSPRATVMESHGVANATTNDGPPAPRGVAVTVYDVISETADAVSLVLEIPDGLRDLFAYESGQFLTLRIPSDRTGHVARCYSLSSSPTNDDRPTVTVKRTLGGYGSNWICDNVRPGDTLTVLPPTGVFGPRAHGGDLLLFAAGSGITPIMSIIRSALTHDSGTIRLVYANRDEQSVIFAADLKQLGESHPGRLETIHWLESIQGRPGAAQIAALVGGHTDGEVYQCGPAPFMAVVEEGLEQVGVPHTRVHSEKFVSLTGDPFGEMAPAALSDADEADTALVEVELDGFSHQLTWPRKRNLVEVMAAQGIDVPYSCLEGECGSCACTLVKGEVTMDANSVLDADDLANGFILACQSHPVSDDLTIEF